MNNSIFKNYIDVIGEVFKMKTSLCEELKELDKRVNNLYHVIEFNDLDGPTSMKIFKSLKETLRRRREVKVCLSNIEVVINNKPQSFNFNLESFLSRNDSTLNSYKTQSKEALIKILG